MDFDDLVELGLGELLAIPDAVVHQDYSLIRFSGLRLQSMDDLMETYRNDNLLDFFETRQRRGKRAAEETKWILSMAQIPTNPNELMLWEIPKGEKVKMVGELIFSIVAPREYLVMKKITRAKRY